MYEDHIFSYTFLTRFCECETTLVVITEFSVQIAGARLSLSLTVIVISRFCMFHYYIVQRNKTELNMCTTLVQSNLCMNGDSYTAAMHKEHCLQYSVYIQRHLIILKMKFEYTQGVKTISPTFENIDLIVFYHCSISYRFVSRNRIYKLIASMTEANVLQFCNV